MPRFRFVNVVWGAEFTDAFLRVCLPSQLSPRNLPSFAKEAESRYWIYTTRKDLDTIRKSSSCVALAKIMPVEFFLIDGISRVGKYQAMNQCHAHFIRSAAKDDCSLIFQTPDIVWSDGTFARLFEIYKAGARNVAIGSVRLTKETFLPSLLEKYGKGGIFHSITARQLVRLALEHLHPVTQAQLWRPNNPSRIAQGELFWPVGREGLVIRHFMLQPLMVTPADRDYIPSTTTDADYTDKVCREPTDWHVVSDSDDMCYVDFTTASYGQHHNEGGIKPGSQRVAEEAAWARGNTLRIHRFFVKHKIRFHAEDCSAAWTNAERESDAVIDSILELVDRDDLPFAPARLSKLRYLSPRFWLSKLRQRGPAALFKELCARGQRAIFRRMWGIEVNIRAAD